MEYLVCESKALSRILRVSQSLTSKNFQTTSDSLKNASIQTIVITKHPAVEDFLTWVFVVEEANGCFLAFLVDIEVYVEINIICITVIC